VPLHHSIASPFFFSDNTYSLPAMEKLLVTYLHDPANFAAPFDPKGVPLVSKELETEVKSRPSPPLCALLFTSLSFLSLFSFQETAVSEEPMMVTKATAPEIKNEEAYSRLFASIPELAHLGPLLKSSKSVPLTESETEYVTSVVKHTFNEHVVLQFVIKNTLNDQVLEKVSVTLEFDNEELEAEQIVPIKRLVFNQPESCFISLRKQQNTYPTGKLFLFFSFFFSGCTTLLIFCQTSFLHKHAEIRGQGL